MEIRGLTKFSLIDYPGKLACIVFVGGCNFRCPYCHNPHLVLDPESQPQISEGRILDFLGKRQGRLDGVVISGGEPSIWPHLADFAEKIKALGYFIKLDTNGSNPEKIIQAHEKRLIDAVGVDYKSCAGDYSLTSGCGAENLAARVQKTIKYSVDSGIDLDVRTTIHRKLHPPEILRKMRDELNGLGIREWTLQQFHRAEMIDEELKNEPTYRDDELIDIAKSLGNHTRVRGLKGVFIFTS